MTSPALRFSLSRKLAVLLIVISLAVTERADASTPPTPDTLRVLTYNVGHPDESTFGRIGAFIRGQPAAAARSEAILALIRAQDADIIALQEITPVFLKALARQPWRGRYRLVHTLSDAQLARDGYVLLDPDGMAILSKWPLRLVVNEPAGGKLGRRLLIVNVEIGDTLLRVGTCHLESEQPYSGIRVRQLERFAGKLAWADNALLLGDFNFADGQQPETRALHKHFSSFQDLWLKLQPAGPRTTFIGEPDARLDRILLHARDWAPVDIHLFGTSPVTIGHERHHASDHYGLVATLHRTKGR